MAVKDLIQRWKNYAHMSNLGEIARRKFFNNCFDGVLTCAGIVTGFFIVFLRGISDSTQALVVTGLSTAVAIGISGIWGAYLSEQAERIKKLKDISRAMGVESPLPLGVNTPKRKRNIKKLKEMSRAMGLPEAILVGPEPPKEISSILDQQKEKTPVKTLKTINEQAEHFATIIASMVDGLAPVLGSILPLVPFFFDSTLSLGHFIEAYCILISLLVLLGLFLGRIAGNSGIKYVFHLVLAGVVTLVISMLMGI